MAITEHEVLVKGRVMAGMAFLDEIMPGWEERVSLEWLDIEDPYFCVFGQVRGQFFYSTRSLPDDLIISCGFDGDTQVSCAELTAEWVSAILARREKTDLR